MSDDSSPIRFNPGKSGYFRDDSKTKPTGAAGSKNFSKVLSKGEKKDDPEDDATEIKRGDEKEGLTEDGLVEEMGQLQQEILPQTPPSLFEMSKAQAPKPSKLFAKESQKNPGASLEHVAAKQEGKHAQEDMDDIGLEPEHIGQARERPKTPEASSRPFDLLASASHDLAQSTEKTLQQKNKTVARFSAEQPDLATINPFALSSQAKIENTFASEAKQALPPVKSIQELVNLMVKEAQSLEAEGKTDTTITLKHPPVFEGARLIVTSFDSAKGEFNIAFENLTQAAQRLVNQEDNRANLLLSLEQKGYHVHILTATTVDENRTFTAGVEDPRKERDQEQDESQQQRQQEDEREA